MLAVERREVSVVCNVDVVVVVCQVLSYVCPLDQIRVHQHSVLFVAGDESTPNVFVVIIN